MLSTNSAPWPIASSHQQQRNPYHAWHACTTATATLHFAYRSSISFNPLLKLTHTRDQLIFLLLSPGSRVDQAYPRCPTLPCPGLSRVLDGDTAALTA